MSSFVSCVMCCGGSTFGIRFSFVKWYGLRVNERLGMSSYFFCLGSVHFFPTAQFGLAQRM